MIHTERRITDAERLRAAVRREIKGQTPSPVVTERLRRVFGHTTHTQTLLVLLAATDAKIAS